MGLGHLLRVSWAFALRDLRNALTYRFSFLTRLLGMTFAVVGLWSFARLVDGVGGMANPAVTGALAGMTPCPPASGGSPYMAAWGGSYLPFVLPGLVLGELTTAALRLFA